jgi:predicted ribosome quality control (RQC) complex YloA/Tae2 family protein
VIIELDDIRFSIDFRKKPMEIADNFYKVAKKAAKKKASVIEQIKLTEKQLDETSTDITIQQEEDAVILKKRKRNWYEKYHWTITTHNYLVIAGKDIKSNEEIAKKRMVSTDLFFHADVRGAPYTIFITNSSDESYTEEDLFQAAHLGAVFSSSWNAGYTSSDVYYVPASSVSFSAPSGEYIPKGGIMVRGDRTFIKGINLELAVGVVFDEYYASVIYGTKETIQDQCDLCVLITPGDVPKGKTAKKLQSIFIKKFEGKKKTKIKALDLNEFVQAVPGSSQIKDVISK